GVAGRDSADTVDPGTRPTHVDVAAAGPAAPVRTRDAGDAAASIATGLQVDARTVADVDARTVADVAMAELDAATDAAADVANMADVATATAVETTTREAARIGGRRGGNGSDADGGERRQSEQGSLGLAKHVSLQGGGCVCLPIRRRYGAARSNR